MEVITLGSGCFWCTETIFRKLEGVQSAVSGYSGGYVNDPTYEQVCSGKTGHAEVVQVTYDPEIITLPDLLEVFWRTHDPTTLNRQGNDVGSQYRSAIFYHTKEQREIAEDLKDKLNGMDIWTDPIVTEITPFESFYPAEDYHQDYFERNGGQPYCQLVIAPKVKKFKAAFGDKVK